MRWLRASIAAAASDPPTATPHWTAGTAWSWSEVAHIVAARLQGRARGGPGSGSELGLRVVELALHPHVDGHDDRHENRDAEPGDDRVLDGLEAAFVRQEALEHG